MASGVTAKPCHGCSGRGSRLRHGLGVAKAAEVILWLFWDPTMCPQWFFKQILESFGPRDGEWRMALFVAPGAEPKYVLGCSWHIAQRACLWLVSLLVMDGCLVPGLNVVALGVLLPSSWGPVFNQCMEWFRMLDDSPGSRYLLLTWS